MQYQRMEKAVFLNRPNRFVAHIELHGTCEVCHVKNTGRCRELLLPGAEIYVQYCENPARKTRYDLISVKKGDRLINMDSQAPNTVTGEWLNGGGLGTLSLIRPETVFEDSRFDFYLENEANTPMLLEVKGVTLEENGVALFPDAPTLRGVKHLEGLRRAALQGMQAAVLFVIQMKGISCLRPNLRTHQDFARALREAKAAGVLVLAYDCIVTPQSLQIDQKVQVEL